MENLPLTSNPIEKLAKSVFKEVIKSRQSKEVEDGLEKKGLSARICVDAHQNDSEFSRIVQDEFAGIFDVMVVPPKDEAHQYALEAVKNNDIQGVILLNGPSAEGVFQAFTRFTSYRKNVSISPTGRLAVGKTDVTTDIPPSGPGVHILTIREDGIDPQEKAEFMKMFT